MHVRRSGQISCTDAGRKSAHLSAVTVVEDIGRMRIGDVFASHECGLEDIESLVVRTDEHVDSRVAGDGGTLSSGYPPSKECEGCQHGPTEEFAGVQHHEKNRIRPPPRVEQSPAEIDPGPHQGGRCEDPDQSVGPLKVSSRVLVLGRHSVCIVKLQCSLKPQHRNSGRIPGWGTKAAPPGAVERATRGGCVAGGALTSADSVAVPAAVAEDEGVSAQLSRDAEIGFG